VHDIEDFLRNYRPPQPSAHLHARMGNLFAQAAGRKHPMWPRAARATALCAASAAAGFFTHAWLALPEPPPPPPAVRVYIPLSEPVPMPAALRVSRFPVVPAPPRYVTTVTVLPPSNYKGDET
jgi:hypothetical protein